MSIFTSFSNFFGSYNGNEKGYGDSQYGEDALLGVVRFLSYQECKDIYTHWPLGKRIANALPTFAMSAPRIVKFGNLPPCIEEHFNNVCLKYRVDDIVKQTAVYARVFGMAALYVAHSSDNFSDPLTYDDLKKGDIKFNVLDPLQINGAEISQNPLSYNYQEVKSIRVNGVDVSAKRILAILNDTPFYLRWIPSNYNWGAPSVYQNMYGLIKSWNRCVIALERMATKAGSIIVKSRDSAVLSSAAVLAAQKTLQLIRDMQNDGAAQVEKDADIEFFNLTGVDVVDSIISQMNQLILMALSDTPSAILLDKDLAQGFGEGSEDMKALLMAVDSFRSQILRPLYDFIDRYILAVAFTKAELTNIWREHSEDLKELEISNVSELREEIFKQYMFEWGNLYPETEATKLDNATKKLQNYQALQQLGANIADIEMLVNNDDLFSEPITFEEKNLQGDGEGLGGGDAEMPSPPEAPETKEALNQDKE